MPRYRPSRAGHEARGPARRSPGSDPIGPCPAMVSRPWLMSCRGRRRPSALREADVDLGGRPADHSCMRSDDMLRRFTSFGRAALVLVSSLTCMTVACRVVCAAEGPAAALGRPAAAAPAGDADLPPCHRAAPGGSSTAPAPAGGGCDAGTVCCSTWLHDRDIFVMAAPVLLRERLA